VAVLDTRMCLLLELLQRYFSRANPRCGFTAHVLSATVVLRSAFLSHAQVGGGRREVTFLSADADGLLECFSIKVEHFISNRRIGELIFTGK
jgi:hypothetical protein